MYSPFSGSARHRRFVVAAICLLGVVVGPSLPDTAAAYNLVDNDELNLNVSALGEAGYVVEDPVTGGSIDYGPRVSLARLKVDGTFKDYGSVTVQTGVRNNNVVLLDAVVALTAPDSFSLQLGRFKSPVSLEYLIGAPNLLFFSRAAIRGFVPGRRIGSQAEYVVEASDNLTITPQVALFQPPAGSIGNPLGASVVGRVLVEPGDDVDIHLAAAEFIFDENEATADYTPTRPYDQILDAGVAYDTNRWNIHGEGVYVTDPAFQTDYAAAGYAHLGHRLGDLEAVSYEPTLGYDIFGLSSEQPNHRVTTGINLYINGEHLMATADYRLSYIDDSLGHTGVLQLQGNI